MSERYEVVVSCFLRSETPEPVLAACRWHLGIAGDFPEGLDDEDHPWQLFLSYPNTRLPGGDSGVLRRSVSMSDDQGQPLWELFTRNWWVDDNVPFLDPFLGLVAPHVAFPGYGGFLRHVFDNTPTVFVFRDGGWSRSAAGEGR